GFRTARGRPLPVSAEALKKVEHIFKEMSASDDGQSLAKSKNAPPTATGGGGFRTARGKALVVSAEALAKVEHLFRGDSPVAATAAVAVAAAATTTGPPMGSGHDFQTARGRPLAVSLEALAKVEHMFGE
ncbi:unnamed protein product, partial [Hapterophycus canaliculatus]